MASYAAIWAISCARNDVIYRYLSLKKFKKFKKNKGQSCDLQVESRDPKRRQNMAQGRMFERRGPHI
ncbi:Uncharacterized protein TCM_040068 [Theobroma cacao]|uniref:Uncharacterized protein n=1 Tax=Theobroma cacao TaxID=3641 RepID=A0A061GR52_THECC|nr:Uncharacterized protein TCM_040068 [Theobroma cacao]